VRSAAPARAGVTGAARMIAPVAAVFRAVGSGAPGVARNNSAALPDARAARARPSWQLAAIWWRWVAARCVGLPKKQSSRREAAPTAGLGCAAAWLSGMRRRRSRRYSLPSRSKSVSGCCGDGLNP
jgi:hypothetical protein